VVALSLVLLWACSCDGDTGQGGDSDVTDSGTTDTSPADDTADTRKDSDSAIDTDSGSRGYPVDEDGDGVLSDEDCDDRDPTTHPGAEEWCDPVDHDCDGELLAEGVCGKGQDLEVVSDTWIDGDEEFDLINTPYSAGNLDGVPGEEVLVATGHQGLKTVAVLSMDFPLPASTSITAAASNFLMAENGSPVRWGGGGDHNGDGLDDAVIVSDAGWNGGYGAVNLLLGPSTDWPHETTIPDAATSIWVDVYTDEDHAEVGQSIATNGDYNGDGLHDIVVGANDGAHNYFFIAGRQDPPDGEADVLENVASLFTISTLAAIYPGDLDGDGLDEVLVSSREIYLLSGTMIPDSGTLDILESAAHFSSWRDPCEGDAGILDVLGISDWSGDGIPDIAHLCAEDATTSDFQDTVHILDGATLGGSPDGRLLDYSLGSWLTEREDTTDDNWLDQFFVSPDVDGDSLPEVAMVNRVYSEGPEGERKYDDRLVLQVSSDGMPGPYEPLSTRGYYLYTDLSPGTDRGFSYPSAADVNGDGLGDLLLDVREDDADSSSYHQRLDVVLGWDLPWHEPVYW